MKSVFRLLSGAERSQRLTEEFVEHMDDEAEGHDDVEPTDDGDDEERRRG